MYVYPYFWQKEGSYYIIIITHNL